MTPNEEMAYDIKHLMGEGGGEHPMAPDVTKKLCNAL